MERDGQGCTLRHTPQDHGVSTTWLISTRTNKKFCRSIRPRPTCKHTHGRAKGSGGCEQTVVVGAAVWTGHIQTAPPPGSHAEARTSSCRSGREGKATMFLGFTGSSSFSSSFPAASSAHTNVGDDGQGCG